MSTETSPSTASPTHKRPRLAFLGTGWIGRHRMKAIAATGLADIVIIADAALDLARQARAEVAPGAEVATSLEELLRTPNLDALVIATPSALHAEQSIAALERRLAVFCQKPLARTKEETARVVQAAQTANCLLGVDLSYRYIDGVAEMRRIVQSGELGRIFNVDLTFHNAYGPDKNWFYNKQLSGGGCLIDLGVHLVDLALWTLGFPEVTDATGRLYNEGEPLIANESDAVEDFASAHLITESKANINLACSWRLNVGCEAVIEAAFYGTDGAVRLRNLDGSFYRFRVERMQGTQTDALASADTSDTDSWAWGGRAAVEWTQRLAAGEGFNGEALRFIETATVLDRIYGR